MLSQVKLGNAVSTRFSFSENSFLGRIRINSGMTVMIRKKIIAEIFLAFDNHSTPLKTEIKKRHEFEFVIDDRNIYHYAADFRSPQAKAQFRNYLQLKESYNLQQNKLENMRIQYSRANQNERSKIAPAILDLEKRVLQLANEVDRTAMQVRKLEKQTIK